ncbi:MAG: hypothetical protein ACRCV7_01405, partial [Culicoidibacterales bacterium]
MKQMLKSIVIMSLVYILAITGILFIVHDISSNGYNPYGVSCGKTCFKNLNVQVKLNQDGSANFVEQFQAYREKSGEYVYLEHYYNHQYGEYIDKSSIKLDSGNGQLKPEITMYGEKQSVKFKIFSSFVGTKTFKFSYTVNGFVKQL